MKKRYLFGSNSRNEADENSEIDILVDLDYTKPIGMKFSSFKDELVCILKKKVGFLSYEGLSKHIKVFVNKDKLLIYERYLFR
jgi:predicted nucleotidyltransferase